MKHILNFDTVAEYDAVKDSLEQPYVVTIDENDGLQYNTDVIRVPSGSDGGSVSGGSRSPMRYIRMSNDNGAWLNMIMYATLVAAEFEDGGNGIITPYLTKAPSMKIKVGKGLAFCWDAKIMLQGQIVTLGESMENFCEQFGVQLEYITEEEFYSL